MHDVLHLRGWALNFFLVSSHSLTGVVNGSDLVVLPPVIDGVVQVSVLEPVLNIVKEWSLLVLQVVNNIVDNV